MANWFPTPQGFNGINLDNYVANQRSYNSVVYVRKRFVNNPQEFKKDINKAYKQNVTKCNEKETEKNDKGIQFDGVTHDEPNKKRTHKQNTKTDDVMMNHTVQFAKKLFPLIIPSENCDDPVYFSVKTKKPKKKPQDHCNNKDLTYEKNKVKKINDSSRRTKVINQTHESLSAKESASEISQNTLDDFNINESLTCTISGISEKKYVKKDKDCRNHKKSNSRKLAVSNSLEALATELADVNEGANIKIHLMNETDKHVFSESLQVPIVNAIKECITELNQYDRIDSQFQAVQRFIAYNNEKLNFIADKITCLEDKIENQSKKQIEVLMKPPRVLASKSSKLEQLGEDLEELSDHLFENESTEAVENKKMYDTKSVIATLDKINHKDENMRTHGGGETLSPVSNINEVAVMKPDRPNRIPTRFCWTDSGRS